MLYAALLIGGDNSSLNLKYSISAIILYRALEADTLLSCLASIKTTYFSSDNPKSLRIFLARNSSSAEKNNITFIALSVS